MKLYRVRCIFAGREIQLEAEGYSEGDVKKNVSSWLGHSPQFLQLEELSFDEKQFCYF
jgi:hypothetical protein